MQPGVNAADFVMQEKIFRNISFVPDIEGLYRARGGDTFKAVVEFSTPIRAKAMLIYGNASQPGSPHRSDQLELLPPKKLRPVRRSRADIETHLEKKEIF